MSFSLWPWFMAATLLVACGDDGQTGGGPLGGGPGTGGGGEVDPDPILERAPVISHDCTEKRPMASEAGAMNARLEGLVALGGDFFVTAVAETLDIATVGLDGSLGEPLTVASTPYAAHGSLTISDGTDLVMIWSEGEALFFARIDSSLTLVEGPTAIAGATGASVSAAALLPTDGGFALLYGAGSGSTMNLRFLSLDADGQAAGESVLVADLGEQYAASATMTATGDGGFAVAYTSGNLGAYSVMFVLLDGDGTQRFTPKRISQAPGGNSTSGFSYNPRRNIVKVGAGYWVAYVETEADYDAMKGGSIIRVAVVDSEGNATIHPLEAPVDQVESGFPTFVELDDGLGLAWTTGSVIWVCGGCITDYDLHFVVLDTTALAPASEVVTHVHETNGITTPIVAVAGEDLLTGGNLDFHAVTLPATGAMKCVATD